MSEYKKIRILHLIKTLNLGGAETNIFNLVQALDRDKFEIHIAYSFGGEIEKRFIRLHAEDPRCELGDECVQIRYGEMSPLRVGGGPRRSSDVTSELRRVYSGTTAVKPWGSIGSDVRLFKFAEENYKVKSIASFFIILRLIRYIIRNKIQIVHTHNFSAHIWGSIAAKITGRKIIEHVHDFRYLVPDEFKRRRGTNKQYRYIKCLKNVSDLVVVLTQQNYNFLLDNKFCPKNRIREIQNGISFKESDFTSEEGKRKLRQRFNLKEDSIVILTPARIAPEKNIDLIFRIVPLIMKEFTNAIFIISGDGPLLREFKLKVRELHLENNLKMIGFYAEIYDLMAISDIFLLPSFLELHSIAILEAMSMKIPVIVSKDTGCNNEFIRDWQNGILLDPFSDNGWTEAIIKLLKEPQLRGKIGQNGYETCASKFNIKDVAKKIEEIYAELTSK